MRFIIAPTVLVIALTLTGCNSAANHDLYQKFSKTCSDRTISEEERTIRLLNINDERQVNVANYSTLERKMEAPYYQTWNCREDGFAFKTP